MSSVRFVAVSFLIFLPGLVQAQIFGTTSTMSTGKFPTRILLVDVDQRLGDDIVLANQEESTVAVYFALGDGTFQAASTAATVSFPTDVVALDMDGDGDQDLVASTSGTTSSLEILANDGAGAFTKSTLATTHFIRKLAVADLDRDNHDDLAAADENDDAVTLFLGDGAGGFSAKADSLVGDNPVDLAAADFDGANGPDLAVVHTGVADGVTVLINQGGASFGTPTEYPVTAGGNPMAVIAVDLDGANGLDLVTANSLTDDLSVLMATGSGLFQAAVSYSVPTGGFPVDLSNSDVDGDGNVDLLVAQRTGRSASVFYGDGAGGLTADSFSPYALPLDAMAVELSDLDYDNAPELVAVTADTGDPTATGLVAWRQNQLGPLGPYVTTTSLPAGVMGASYATTLSAAGGVPPYSWDLAAGSLPAGITLDPATGVLSGTPTLAAVGTSYMTVRVRDAAFDSGVRPLSLVVSSPASVLLAKGNGTTSSYDQRLAAYQADGTAIAALTFTSYNLTGYGVRIGGAELDGDGLHEILLSPGPGPDHPPAVRGYDRTGASVPFVDYFAYGVLRYGASSKGGDIDGSGVDEIVTGPGAGPSFGPQVRGWSYDGKTFPAAIPAVNFYAYGTLRFGVNPDAADLDGDAIAELLTGAGAGAVFGPHVRGFDYDGSGGVASLSGLSFFAYKTLKFGVHAAGAELDGDAASEILTGPGPGSIFGAHLRGFDYSGSVKAIGNISAIVLAGTLYGANVAAADLELDGFDEILTGAGPDPAAAPELAAFDYDATRLSKLSALSSVKPFAGLAYGVRTGGMPLGY